MRHPGFSQNCVYLLFVTNYFPLTYAGEHRSIGARPGPTNRKHFQPEHRR